MRWKRIHSRVIRRFALFPIEIDEEFRWLEVVYIWQRLRWTPYSVFYDYKWENKEFVDKEFYKTWRKQNAVT